METFEQTNNRLMARPRGVPVGIASSEGIQSAPGSVKSVAGTMRSNVGTLGRQPIPRENIDTDFDVFLTAKDGGMAAGDNPFTISDATDAGIEQILVAPGLLEVINGGFSTFIVPTLGGNPITDQTPIAAVSGSVYLEVTINAGSGIPTAAAVMNAASLPADTATLKHIQIGTITVGTDEVTVDSQDVTSDIRYHVRARGALQLYFDVVAGDQKVRISYGSIDGEVPPEAQGGSGPVDYDPVAAKYWAVSEYDESGQTGVVSIDSGAVVPDDTPTATYYLIGEVQIVGSEPVIFPATAGSLNSFRCGEETYSWGGA